ncbi:TlpA disulfide reductase family protein [Pedobacter sp. JY14-1]|uniref:peroxiredoxin family protein n=1 Tax=Pedobacter sp. JY14-1 TaxID=3034151 RepID=UPI0023E0B073|nr:TlpA disulfide reductase family protein [Pedobacter sp. JY14-1]
MSKRTILFLIFLLSGTLLNTTSYGQTLLKTGKWYAKLSREDGHAIPFELEVKKQGSSYTIAVVNGTESLLTESNFSGDSVTIQMPVFESSFRAKINRPDSISGRWIKGGPVKDLVMPFTAVAGGDRFPGKAGAATSEAARTALSPGEIGGKWDMDIIRADQTRRKAIGEFIQQERRLSGSVLTPSGDYRYLAGTFAGDSLFLSTFDGIHAILIKGRMMPDHTAPALEGMLYSSTSAPEKWTAVKDASVKLAPAVTTVKEGSDGKPAFSYKDLDGKTVSLSDERFKDKVVVLQLMGSWCPNCMDETAFLSEYYRRNKSRGVEIIGLAYELTTDVERSAKSLQKFRDKFAVEYPMLITGVAVGDPQRTEKTLPQLSEIKVFPTSVILDKKGVIREISTSFYGPATGEYYTKYKTHFENAVNRLLNE